MSIHVDLSVIMAKRNIKLKDLAAQVGVTEANLSILKNNKARAIRFQTLDQICKALDCEIGDVLVYKPEEQ